MPDRHCPPSVQRLFQNYDKALKIEWAGDRWACKRKGRDGRYFTIGYCRPDLLGDGKMWLNRLASGDIWKQFGGSGTRAADEMDRHEREAESKRKLDRRDKFEHMAREEFAVIQRKCGERISNAGMPGVVASLILAVLLAPLFLFGQAFGQQITPVRVSQLPTSGAVGMVRVVSDGQTGNDCTVGGGTFTVLCVFDGASSWQVPPSGRMYLYAGERLQDSATKSHVVVVDAANLAVISKTTAATIGGGVANDTYLKRIIVLTALNGTCVVTGFADSDGAAQSFTIPTAFVGERNFGGAKNSAGALTITCSNALDDNFVLVEWWPAS